MRTPLKCGLVPIPCFAGNLGGGSNPVAFGSAKGRAVAERELPGLGPSEGTPRPLAVGPPPGARPRASTPATRTTPVLNQAA